MVEIKDGDKENNLDSIVVNLIPEIAILEDVEVMKKINYVLENKPIEQVLKYMTDPSRDSLNENEYPPNVKTAVKEISKWFDLAHDEPNSYSISIKGIKDDDSTMPLDIGKSLSSYSNDISKMVELDDGSNVKLYEMTIRKNMAGGFYKK
jgi:ATP-dependent protease HslVU (ClpYQ) ATPase subunit